MLQKRLSVFVNVLQQLMLTFLTAFQFEIRQTEEDGSPDVQKYVCVVLVGWRGDGGDRARARETTTTDREKVLREIAPPCST